MILLEPFLVTRYHEMQHLQSRAVCLATTLSEPGVEMHFLALVMVLGGNNINSEWGSVGGKLSKGGGGKQHKLGDQRAVNLALGGG